MDNPKGLRPVLAKINGMNCLGKTSWHEVVYFDEELTGQWQSYSDSKTFSDEEKVDKWVYVEDCFCSGQ